MKLSYLSLCLVHPYSQRTHHPEEGSCGEVCILLDGGQHTEDQTHQDHEEAEWRRNISQSDISTAYSHRFHSFDGTCASTYFLQQTKRNKPNFLGSFITRCWATLCLFAIGFACAKSRHDVSTSRSNSEKHSTQDAPSVTVYIYI